MKNLYGVTTAMVTPFTRENEVDYNGIRQLTRMLIEKGVNCLYPCGTTGEMLRLSLDERKKIAETVVETANGKVLVFIHCGCMNQEDTIELVQHAKKAGADGAGVVTPVFFGLSDEEMKEYYITVAGSAKDFPIYLYNIPQCASNDLKTSVAKEIAEQCPNVVGIKYSFADMNRTVDYISINDGKFSVLHGCDRVMLSMLAAGCQGVVSGISGVFPEPFAAVWNAWRKEDWREAQRMQKICVRFCDALKGGSNMSYFKEALKLRGIAGGFMRMPQLNIGAEQTVALKEELECICEDAGISLKISDIEIEA